MGDSTPNDPLREAHLLSKMREKETEELLTIWQKNDRQAWSDDAFEAIHQVLQERLEEIPEQAQPVKPPRMPPNLHRLTTIAAWAKFFSWVVLVIAGLAFVYSLTFVFIDTLSTNWISWIVAELSSIAFAGFAFIVLQAVAEIIYFLLNYNGETPPTG